MLKRKRDEPVPTELRQKLSQRVTLWTLKQDAPLSSSNGRQDGYSPASPHFWHRSRHWAFGHSNQSKVPVASRGEKWVELVARSESALDWLQRPSLYLVQRRIRPLERFLNRRP